MRSARTHHLFGINASSVYPKCIIRFGRNGDASFYALSVSSLTVSNRT